MEQDEAKLELLERFQQVTDDDRHMIADRVGDFVRHMVRALASASTSGNVYNSVGSIDSIVRLLLNDPRASLDNREMIALGRTLELAVRMMSENLSADTDSVDGAIVGAAKAGASLLIERSCSDNAAAGRASRAEDRFLAAIDRINLARERVQARADKTRR